MGRLTSANEMAHTRVTLVFGLIKCFGLPLRPDAALARLVVLANRYCRTPEADGFYVVVRDELEDLRYQVSALTQDKAHLADQVVMLIASRKEAKDSLRASQRRVDELESGLRCLMGDGGEL